MENKALGKGLLALIPEKMSIGKSEGVMNIRIQEIYVNSQQPRTNFDEAKLSGLISSIKEKGVLQPILVRPKNGKYEIIAGERRYRAAKALEMTEVPVIIKSVDDREALVLALVENIQREELNVIEEAQAYKRLIEDFQFTQDIVAESVGKDRSTISNCLRLLKLPSDIQKGISDDLITMGHARALLGIDDLHEQKNIFTKIVNQGLSVRELENLIKSRSNHGVKRKKTGSPHQKDPYLASTEEDLQKILGTKVRIDVAKKRGRIVIEYYSQADLGRIVEILKK